MFRLVFSKKLKGILLYFQNSFWLSSTPQFLSTLAFLNSSLCLLYSEIARLCLDPPTPAPCSRDYLQVGTWGDDTTHPICIPFLSDHSLILHIVKCLKMCFLYFISLPIVSKEKIIPHPLSPHTEAETLYLSAFKFFLRTFFMDIFTEYKILLRIFLSSLSPSFLMESQTCFKSLFPSIQYVFIFPLAAFTNLCLLFRTQTMKYLSVLFLYLSCLEFPEFLNL